MRWRRISFIIGLCLLGCSALLAIAGWVVISRWVPTHGKVWLIQELERPGIITASIGALQYSPMRGFMLTDVILTERATGERWAQCSTIHASVSWINALIRRQVTFRARIILEHPANTSLTLTGTYPLRERSLSLRITSEDIPIRSIHPPVQRWMPLALTDGLLRLQAHLQRSPHGPVVMTGQLIGSALDYRIATGHFVGDFVLDGTAVRSDPHARWDLEGTARIEHGRIDGLPTIGAITQLEAIARLRPGEIMFERITYDMVGSAWSAQGRLQTMPSVAWEALTTSRIDLGRLNDTLPALGTTWQLQGEAELRVMCRGTTRPTAWTDCLAAAGLRDATVSGAMLPTPITDLSGGLRYDLLTQQLDLEHVQGRMAQHPIGIEGSARLTNPPSLAVHLTGRVPLEAAAAWLPTASPVQAPTGFAAVDLHITGPPASAEYVGTVQLREAGFQLGRGRHTVDQLDADLSLASDRLSTTDGRARWNGQPITVVAAITPRRQAMLTEWLRDADIEASIGLSYGRVQFTGRSTEASLVIDRARLSLAHSDVVLQGTLSRQPERTSRLAFAGTLELADLTTLPFPALEALVSWQLQGTVAMEGAAAGLLGRWSDSQVDAHVGAERVALRGVPLERVTCTLQQRDGGWRIVVPSALLGGGKFWGQFAFGSEDAADAFQFEADVVALQLEQLAQAIPAWRQRSVTGTASAHAVLSGRRSERNGWRGEGWLDASGERLADLPLLDRLSQHALLGPLAEWLRWDLLRRAEITRASLRWRLADGQVRTDDLRLGGAVQNVPVVGSASVALYVQGSVGMDESLDLTVRPELSEQVMSQSQVLGGASSVIKAAGLLEKFFALARYRVTGTIKEPRTRFESTPQDLVSQLLQWSPVDLLDRLFRPPPSGE